MEYTQVHSQPVFQRGNLYYLLQATDIIKMVSMTRTSMVIEIVEPLETIPPSYDISQQKPAKCLLRKTMQTSI